MLVALTLAAPDGLAARIHASAVAKPCRVVARAPVHTGGAPGKTVATMHFTCTRRHSQAIATVQSQKFIRGRWSPRAARTITFFQLKRRHRYKATTPPIDCSPGEYRTVASVKTGSRTTQARSHTVTITCG
ncbi:MAG: hypothetical protein QOG63_1828 [Thermoleophilaceae bacterium]|jgi:hypothetical protein|nr:hypothetical protein [Thermoleophilaceae bacterium]